MSVHVPKESARILLDAAYTQLEFDRGVLLPASKRPDLNRPDEWLERGDWQALAEEVCAEKVFFVEREPVVVFAELKSPDDGSFREFYNRVWCMARPQFLFLARLGELAIYDLSKPPLELHDQPGHCRQLLARAETLAQIQELRSHFHRELVETGAVFGDERFGKGLNRADDALIRDLKAVRRALDALPLRDGTRPSPPRKSEMLHSLIGRAIFIRYLEDRQIITRAYFDKVIELHGRDAAGRKEWRRLLDQQPFCPDVSPAKVGLLFPRVLANKEFTYALFDQLAHDFNGDTFPVEHDERRGLLQAHLTKLRDFLLGVRDANQPELFFHAYDFSIIPIELISSIYEEFYNERVGDDKNQGAHYTPPALVEFVLANTLTREVLETKPRVLDPACGSGIFLVEAFRRMVRHLCAEKGMQRPTRQELRAILRKQIAGVDINKEAVRVTAFSLCLAFLHYQQPREILPDPGENLSQKPEKLRSIRLPCLMHVPAAEKVQREKARPGLEFFDTLLAASAFDPIMGKCDAEVNKSFGPGCADAIVGNPPWGDPTPRTAREKQAVADLKAWCNPDDGRPVGDTERSQAFVHLTLSLLGDGGKAGLLVSSGVFFKHHDNSKAFRKVWLKAVQLRHVVNFAHVRHVFFSGPHRKTKGISPFASVVFEKNPLSAAPDNRFDYWSAKRTALVENTRAVVMTRGDMHYLSQSDCLEFEKLWKIYWWGGPRDEALVRTIERLPKLVELPDASPAIELYPGRGFEVTRKGKPAGWLTKYREMPLWAFKRYGPPPLAALRDVPRKVYRKGEEQIYSGRRLLVGRGIKKGGLITARLETETYCFRNAIHGVRLAGLEPWQEAAIIGICWSSLAQYYYFATAGSWGLWHDEIHLEDVQQLPIRFPGSSKLRDRISGIVGQLRDLELEPGGLALAGTAAQRSLPELERQLNEAIFDLYELSATERDSVRDMCTVGLDLYYRNHESDAVKGVVGPARNSGTIADVTQAKDGLAAYLRVFLEWWNAELAPDGEFAWRVLSPPSGAPLLAVSFETRYPGNASAPFDTANDAAWQEVLKKLAKYAHVSAGSSRIFTDTFFRVATEREILIVKRNERRFWTKSAAREDAEAATVSAMRLQAEPANA